jgi:hypothetical protein
MAREIRGRNCSRHIGADNSLAKLERNIYHLQVTVKYYLMPACYSTFMKMGRLLINVTGPGEVSEKQSYELSARNNSS